MRFSWWLRDKKKKNKKIKQHILNSGDVHTIWTWRTTVNNGVMPVRIWIEMSCRVLRKREKWILEHLIRSRHVKCSPPLRHPPTYPARISPAVARRHRLTRRIIMRSSKYVLMHYSICRPTLKLSLVHLCLCGVKGEKENYVQQSRYTHFSGLIYRSSFSCCAPKVLRIYVCIYFTWVKANVRIEIAKLC